MTHFQKYDSENRTYCGSRTDTMEFRESGDTISQDIRNVDCPDCLLLFENRDTKLT